MRPTWTSQIIPHVAPDCLAMGPKAVRKRPAAAGGACGASPSKAPRKDVDLGPFDVASEQLRRQVEQGRLPGFMSSVLKERKRV